MLRRHSHTGWSPRVLPFAAFMAFVGVEEGISYISGLSPLLSAAALYDGYVLYPIKTALVAGMVLFFRPAYTELKFKGTAPAQIALSLLAGALVFVLWINLDFLAFGTAQGYNPYAFGDGLTPTGLAAVRLFGASMVVPVMEEIFWRSFLIRYIIDNDFEKVRVGAFTWPSFLLTALLFGLEHNLWLAGIVAGVVYNLLLYRTKSLACCIISHSATNLLLGIYVLLTGSWQFW